MRFLLAMVVILLVIIGCGKGIGKPNELSPSPGCLDDDGFICENKKSEMVECVSEEECLKICGD